MVDRSTLKLILPTSTLFLDESTTSRLAPLCDGFEWRPNITLPRMPQPIRWAHLEWNVFDAAWLDRHLDASFIDALESLNLEMISLHACSAALDCEIVDRMFVPRSRVLEPDELLDLAVKNVARFSEHYSGRLAIENNNYFPTAAYDHICDPAFITRLIQQTGTELLLDIGHARISSWNMHRPLDDYLEQLPLERCRMLHFCRNLQQSPISYDHHDAPDVDDWQQLWQLVADYRLPTSIVVEYYKDAQTLEQSLRTARTTWDQQHHVN